MAPTKHCLANGHEVRNHVVAISNELLGLSMLGGDVEQGGAHFLKVIRNQGLRLLAILYERGVDNAQ
jgi:hypothetical protein